MSQQVEDLTYTTYTLFILPLSGPLSINSAFQINSQIFTLKKHTIGIFQERKKEKEANVWWDWSDGESSR